MENKAVRAAPWSLLTYGTTRVILLVNAIVLARLLDPGDFGVLALAMLAVGAFGFFGELGLGSAFTLRQDLDRRSQGTVLLVMLLAGGITAGLVAALSPVIAGVFDEPRLAPVLAVLSAILFVNGFTWFYDRVLVRELEFRRRFFAVLVQAVTNLVVSVTVALVGGGVWSLVAGQLAGMAAQGVALLTLAPYRVPLVWDAAVARELIAAGRGFMALGGLSFVRQNLDYFAVARVLGSRPLGFYSMAYRLSELPAAGFAGPISAVTFPAFARMRARGEDVSAPYLATVRIVALITAPIGVGLSAASGPIVLALFGPEWRPMAGALTALGLWAVLRPLQVTGAWFLNALGRPGASAVLTAASIGLLGPGTFLAASSGIGAVAWVMVAEATITLALHMWVIGRLSTRFRTQLSALWPVAVACPAAWLAVRGVSGMVADMAPPLSLVLSGVALAAAYLGVLALIAPSRLREAGRLAARTLTPTKPGTPAGPRPPSAPAEA